MCDPHAGAGVRALRLRIVGHGVDRAGRSIAARIARSTSGASGLRDRA